jgi:two-component system CitB family response regulator
MECALLGLRNLPRVLLVEDDRRAHQLLQEVLVNVGFEVISAMTQASGLAGLSRRVDCVILDLQLPDGCGEAILRAIRGERLPVRVAVTTAVADPERLRKLAALGPDLVLHKPIDLPELLRWLEQPVVRARRTRALVGSVN